jgi:hypothetical protein
MLNLKVPEGLLGKLALQPRLAEMGKFPPRVKGGRPPCQEVILRGDAVNLDEIPFLTTWPGDGGRYITLPMVITTDPSRGIRNVGMYRIQVLGRDTLAMHWQRHKVGAAHWREMAARGERMPVVEEHVLEHERGAAAGTLHAAVGDLGDLEPGTDGMRHADQLAEAVDLAEEFAQVV